MAKYDTVKMLAFSIKCATVFWAQAEKRFGCTIGEMPAIKMNSRLTAVAGRAWLSSDFIDLSCYLMEKYPQVFNLETIPHELCHFIAYRLFNDKGHGPNWKYVMSEMGLAPERCHSMVTKYQAERGMK
jgi:predicted SprT family Zn-dependent metalloprotease